MNKFIIISIVAILVFFTFKKGGLLNTTDMPYQKLAVYGQDEYDPINDYVGGRCPDAKCLTIYVAPWCPQCTKAKPMILKLTEELRSEGINVSVIVGNDSVKAVKKYAKDYPFPVLMDADKSFYNKSKQRGVPFFISSNNKGKVIESHAGFYYEVSDMRKKLAL